MTISFSDFTDQHNRKWGGGGHHTHGCNVQLLTLINVSPGLKFVNKTTKICSVIVNEGQARNLKLVTVTYSQNFQYTCSLYYITSFFVQRNQSRGGGKSTVKVTSKA